MTSYRESGVDLDGSESHTRAISESVTSTWKADVVGGFGGFAAGVRIPEGYRDLVLMMSTDGVGTKLEIARRVDRWDGVGHDLVAMCVDDLAAVGATPIGFVDYLAVGALRPHRDQAIVDSIARACLEAGCPLLGGETAEHPGVMAPDAVDLAGSAAGMVPVGEVLGPDRVRAGDVVIGLVSPNLRSNGFSLVRRVMGEEVEEHADALLEPSVIYSPAVMAASATGGVHAAAHITGGGLDGNLDRALPPELAARIDRTSWVVPEVFGLVASRGVPDDEMRRVFNMGIGFCLVADPGSVEAVLDATAAHSPRVIGEVAPGKGEGAG